MPPARQARGGDNVIPKLHEEKCTACEQCIEVCPPQAIAIVDGKAKINPDLCEECGICVDECPEDVFFLPGE